tara:strand:- start:920 stop:1438 length:519 start_codon:yes stop_codon:yes gene_type:complete
MTIGTTFSGDYVLAGGEGSDTISFMGAGDAPFEIHAAAAVDNSFWDYDGFSLTGNPNPSPDTITFNIPEKKSNDCLNLDLTLTPNWKYREQEILNELETYLKKTYGQHYSDAKSSEQTLDKIKSSRKEGFFAGNVVKYIDRYDSKGTPRQDLFKVLHYTMLLIDHLDLVEEN